MAIIPAQIVLFIASPPPATVAGFFSRFEQSTLLGLLSLDLLYLLSNALNLLLVPALCVSQRRVDKSLALIAFVLGITGSAMLFVSNVAFDMLHLYGQYAAATTEAQRALFLAAGEPLLAIYQGTAYHMHYILGSLALLLIAVVMLRSRAYSRATAIIGIVTNIIAFGLYVPVVGAYISAFSAIGYGIWFVLVGVAFLRIPRGE